MPSFIDKNSGKKYKRKESRNKRKKSYGGARKRKGSSGGTRKRKALRTRRTIR
tara:strand:- start:563 stop:721 length:159 start_codon:yes stop_codon:yes gene_type:complete